MPTVCPLLSATKHHSGRLRFAENSFLKLSSRLAASCPNGNGSTSDAVIALIRRAEEVILSRFLHAIERQAVKRLQSAFISSSHNLMLSERQQSSLYAI